MQVFLLTDRVNNQKCKKIVIDYSSPNIGKQFHIGNLRSTLIGRYLDRVRPSDSYWNSCSDVEKIRAITDCYIVANKKRRIDEVFREEVRQTFAEMENKIVKGDFSSPEMRLWNDVRGISERHLKHFYSLFSIDFDRAVVYVTLELASILHRDDLFHADLYMYVVDRAQRKHFETLRAILSRIGRNDLAEKIEHVPYGRVKGLSTRTGRTEIVGEIIDRGKELALQFMKESKTTKLPPEKAREVAYQLSLSTLIFNDLKRAKSAEYEFSFKNAFDLSHNNALLLQVKHSRLCSIEENNSELLPFLDECDSIPEETPDFTNLAVHLSRFPEVAVPRLLLLSASKAVLHEGISLLGAAPVVMM
ncbi:unnamed protein product [Angiostrongylus costaricensis]|uniref:Probable arginine--tRNA ligase, mitochondrial n=1 Tax=Angiostrongylus costaricensis TaxID=334426 RepID=A0A0R3PSF2_ANGCS|nr:unnamed protein product [Angiostrongylus costaricensis]